jgi:hypothetical protein
MERTTGYRGCRIDASATFARPKLSTVYQITPLTEQAMVVFGGQWKLVTKAGTTFIRDAESSGGDPLPGAIELTLRLATQAIDGIFAAHGEPVKADGDGSKAPFSSARIREHHTPGG